MKAKIVGNKLLIYERGHNIFVVTLYGSTYCILCYISFISCFMSPDRRLIVHVIAFFLISLRMESVDREDITKKRNRHHRNGKMEFVNRPDNNGCGNNA